MSRCEHCGRDTSRHSHDHLTPYEVEDLEGEITVVCVTGECFGAEDAARRVVEDAASDLEARDGDVFEMRSRRKPAEGEDPGAWQCFKIHAEATIDFWARADSDGEAAKAFAEAEAEGERRKAEGVKIERLKAVLDAANEIAKAFAEAERPFLPKEAERLRKAFAVIRDFSGAEPRD